MLLIDTIVRDSGIHGLGCFSNEFIPMGTLVWKYDRRIDKSIRESSLPRFPRSMQRFLETYGYVTRSGRHRVLCGDNARHMNHSDDPNVIDNVASRDIAPGEELTCDYFSFDRDAPRKLDREPPPSFEEWCHHGPFDSVRSIFASALPKARANGQMPDGNGCRNLTFAAIPVDGTHRNETDEFSFVLKPSGLQGVGVFATHGIAAGTRLELFPRGRGFPRFISSSRTRQDLQLRRFCEVYGVETARGYWVAPNFCCMSIGWYLNHSESANARRCGRKYVASRDIGAGEEITIDYREL